MGQRLKDKVAVITGASRGIGQAIAQAYATEGAKLCLLATDAAKLTALKDALGLPATHILVQLVDVRQRDAVFQVVQAAERHFGQIDVLVNNAGVYRSKPFLDYAVQDFQDLLDVNLMGVVNFMQACLPGMQARGSGSIVNIASTAGKWGSRNQSAYNVSKHAVVGLTRCVALEASPYHVTVNAICPGFVQTDMVENLKQQAAQSAGASVDAFMQAALARVPLGRIITPQEIAAMAVYLGSVEASGITGQSLHIDGGMVLS